MNLQPFASALMLEAAAQEEAVGNREVDSELYSACGTQTYDEPLQPFVDSVKWDWLLVVAMANGYDINYQRKRIFGSMLLIAASVTINGVEFTHPSLKL